MKFILLVPLVIGEASISPPPREGPEDPISQCTVNPKFLCPKTKT